jgi:hypothetical protein
MHALTVFRSPVWLLLHKLSSPHYRYIRKMRRGDRLPLTQLQHSLDNLSNYCDNWQLAINVNKTKSMNKILYKINLSLLF